MSYASLPNSVSDAHYTVHHAGGETSFRVNQRMGGGTWLYLGTFLFDEGRNERGRVVLHNESRHKGAVTADAVRFGGGMGIVERSIPTISYAPDSTKIYTYGQGVTSGLPRPHAIMPNWPDFPTLYTISTKGATTIATTSVPARIYSIC